MSNAQTARGVPSAGRQRRRAVPVIDARFQWKYTLLIMALGVGVMAIMGGLLYRAHTDNTRLLDLSGNSILQEQVIRGDQIFLLYLIISVVLMAVMLAIWGLIVTHRISGPLFLVARYFGVLANAQYPDVRPLRKNDELQEFFVAFEEAVAALRDRDVGALRDLEDALADADKAGYSEEAMKKAVDALKRQRGVLRTSLGANYQGVEVE